MPLYDYECTKCGAVEERFEGMNDETPKTCRCGAPQKRILTVNYTVLNAPDFVTDDISGKPIRITDRKQKERLMKEHGVYEKYGKGWV